MIKVRTRQGDSIASRATEARTAFAMAPRPTFAEPYPEQLQRMTDGILEVEKLALQIAALPDIERDKPKRQCFKRYPIGFIHVDSIAHSDRCRDL